MDFGTSKHSSQALLAALGAHFRPGSYDLLRKNCNSFSDVAIYFLTGKRISSKFRQMEKLGSGLLGGAGLGQSYKPNPQADGFDVEAVIDESNIGKWRATPGLKLGGNSGREVLDGEAMRAQRLFNLQLREAEMNLQLKEAQDSRV